MDDSVHVRDSKDPQSDVHLPVDIVYRHLRSDGLERRRRAAAAVGNAEDHGQRRQHIDSDGRQRRSARIVLAALHLRSMKSRVQPAENTDLLQILVFRHTLTREQAERVRRQARSTGATVVQTVQDLGIASEPQISEAVAGFANLKFVTLNPLELDLDVVTRALSGPFSRRHGMVAIAKTDEKLTVAVHDPFAAFPIDDIKKMTGLRTIERVVATRSDIDAIVKSFFELG